MMSLLKCTLISLCLYWQRPRGEPMVNLACCPYHVPLCFLCVDFLLFFLFLPMLVCYRSRKLFWLVLVLWWWNMLLDEWFGKILSSSTILLVLSITYHQPWPFEFFTLPSHIKQRCLVALWLLVVSCKHIGAHSCI